MSATRRAAPRGAQPDQGAAQRRTTVIPSLGEGAEAELCKALLCAAGAGLLCKAARGSERRAV